MVNPALLAAVLAASPESAPDAEPQYQAVTYDAQQITAQSFGLEYQYKTIPASAFMPRSLGVVWYRDATDNYLGTDQFFGEFYAPLDLPNGAQVFAICFVLRDDSDTNDIRVSVWRTEADSTPVPAAIAFSDSSASGYGTECLDWPIPWTYRTFANLDGDLFGGWEFWELKVNLSVIHAHFFLGAYVRYKLSIRPAPISATFADVGTGDAVFPYVEAMAAAGITNGCSATRFCPNDPVTRGQLAVALARALGLHWPF